MVSRRAVYPRLAPCDQGLLRRDGHESHAVHCFVNGGFLEHEEQLLDGVERIRHIPIVIVQGRYAAVCVIATAWEPAQRGPGADFRMVPDAGYTAAEPGIAHEPVTATEVLRAARGRGAKHG